MRRPQFAASYGISAEETGILAWAWAVERLEAARSYWIASASPTGKPHAMPVAGLWLDGAFVFGTSAESRKARDIASNPRVAVHLGSGDEVMVVEGGVDVITLDVRIADAYGVKYDHRPEPGAGSGLWCRVEPRVAYAWLESDYPRTATRFDFG